MNVPKPDAPYTAVNTVPFKLPAGLHLVFRAFLLLCPLLPLALTACSTGGKSVSRSAVPSTALVTEGPSLALVGEYAGMRLEGYMDRSCMTGYGGLGLRAVGQYRRGDIAVAIPKKPAGQAGGLTTAGGPGNTPPSRLTLESYPARSSQRTDYAGTQVRPAPTAGMAASGSGRGKGLQLASYPQEDPPMPVDTRLPEERGDILMPASPPLRTQSPDAAEYESSIPVGIEFICEAKVDAPPTTKARIRGVFACTGGRNILFSLRNTGPDQGVGVGKETEDGSLMVLFYHASMEEARRRFPSVRDDILLVQQRQ